MGEMADANIEDGMAQDALEAQEGVEGYERPKVGPCEKCDRLEFKIKMQGRTIRALNQKLDDIEKLIDELLGPDGSIYLPDNLLGIAEILKNT